MIVAAGAPWLASKFYGDGIAAFFNVLSVAGFGYVFFFGMNLLLRHASSGQLAFGIGIGHALFALIYWFSVWENWDNVWGPRIMAGVGAGTILVVGAGDGVNRAAAAMHMATPAFMQFLGFGALFAVGIVLVLWFKDR